MSGPRLAVRAVILRDDRLLLVNAYPDGVSDLWCAPGGGVERGDSLTDTLIREVYEETGCTIVPGALCLVHEFHDPNGRFHQVDLFFRARLTGDPPVGSWHDPAGVVTERRFFSRDQLREIRFEPLRLPEVAFGPDMPVDLHPLKAIVR